MIIQGLLDFLSIALSELLLLLPPIPSQWTTTLAWLQTGGTWLGTTLAKFSPVVPWLVIQSIVTVWIGLLTFWAAMLVMRLVLWVLGR